MKVATDFDELFKTEKPGRVQWEHDEWHDLATEVLEIRATFPRKSTIELANIAQKNLTKVGNWSSDRCRLIRSNAELSKLYPLLGQLDRDRQVIFKQALDLDKKRKDLEAQGFELDNLSVEDTVTLFGKTVLENMLPEEIVQEFTPDELLGMVPTAKLAGYAVERLVTDLLRREIKLRQHVIQEPATNGHTTSGRDTSGRKTAVPFLSVIGTQPQQFTRLKKQFDARVTLLDVDKQHLSGEAIPERSDAVVVWSRFTSRAQVRLIKKRCRPKSYALTSKRNPSPENPEMSLIVGPLP